MTALEKQVQKGSKDELHRARSSNWRRMRELAALELLTLDLVGLAALGIEDGALPGDIEETVQARLARVQSSIGSLAGRLASPGMSYLHLRHVGDG